MKTKFHYLVLSLIMSVTLFSQAPSWQWTKSEIGGNSISSDLFVDGAGNTYLTGIFSSTISFGSTTLIPVTSQDVFIAKHDSNGNLIWAKSIGGNADVNKIRVDGNGDIYLIGSFSSPTISFGSTILTNLGSLYDIFIVKLNGVGNILWAKSAGGTYIDNIRGIAFDANGSIYITGYYYSSSFTLGTTTVTNSNIYANSSDIFTAKLDNLGNVIWMKSSGTAASNDIPVDIEVDLAENTYIVGNFNNNTIFGNIILNFIAGQYDSFCTKFDPSGNVIWAKSLQGYGYESFNDISIDSYSNIYLVGAYTAQNTSLFGSTNLANNPSSGFNSFIAKCDGTGNVLWNSSIFCTQNHFTSYNSVTVDASGNAYVCGGYSGTTISIGSYTFINTHYVASGTVLNDLVIAKYNNIGNLLWAKTAKGSGDDFCKKIGVDINNNIYVMGSSYNIYDPVDTLFLGNNTIITTQTSIQHFISKLGPYCGTFLHSFTCSPTNNINTVKIAGTTLNNANTGCTGTNGLGYTVYQASGATTATMQIGSTYLLSVATATNSIISAWIDYDRNGSFEANEWTQVTTNSSPNVLANKGITIPSTVTPGPTGMRIRSRLVGNANGANDACTSFGSGETEDYTVYLSPIPATNCVPPYSNCNANNIITNVTFSSINNTSTCSNNGYASYTSPVPNVSKGASYPISVTIGNDPGYTQYVGAWIDYNHNNSFENSEYTSIGSGNGTTLTSTIAIPNTALTGNTKMRVMLKFNTALTNTEACNAYPYGETEDYIINITVATGINESIFSNNISIHPNPTTGVFNIAVSNLNSSELSISIFDIQGKEVYRELDKNIASDYNKQLNLFHLSKGMYYIKLNTGAESSIQKLVIQ